MANKDDGGGIAMFQAGDAALYWEGEWNVDIFQPGRPAVQHAAVPGRVRHRRAQADSHSFVIPVQPSAIRRSSRWC